ncbi:MAG: MarR family winged helix-turn-helix transcriptional regulator [Pseudomonadota bacterium]
MTKKDEFDLKDFLPYLLNQAAEVTSREFQTYYRRRYGMLRTEWRVVFHLGRYGDMTATEICDRSMTHKTKVSRAVKALEKKRFIKRTVVEEDKRNETLSLTPSGRAAFKDLFSAARTYNETVTRRFTAEENDVLRACLAKIADT